MLIRVNKPQNCNRIPPEITGVVLTHLMPCHYKHTAGQKLALEKIVNCCKNLPATVKKFLTINYSPAFNKTKRWKTIEDLNREAASLIEQRSELHFKIDGICLAGEFLRSPDPCFRPEALAPVFAEFARAFDCPVFFTEYNINEIETEVLNTFQLLAQVAPINLVGQMYSDKLSPRKIKEAASLARLSCQGVPIAFIEVGVFGLARLFYRPLNLAIHKQIVDVVRDKFGDKDILCWWNAFPSEAWMPMPYLESGGEAISILEEDGRLNKFGTLVI